MSETWVWNESLSFTEDANYGADFVSNANQYSSIVLHIIRGGLTLVMRYDTTDIWDNATGWTNDAYRTVTFSTAPTGYLLTFLQANATKQQLPGLKNLSSYNQDLSIPRKKDLDALDTKIDGKQDKITGGATTITSSNLTANRALVSNSSGKVAISTVTAIELGYLDGVTSNVQTQLNNKVPTTRTVNNKALSSNITLTASDVGAIPNIPVTTTSNLDMLMVVNGNWQTDHGASGIQDAGSLIVNKWPDNVTVIVRSFRRWGKLCLFTVQIHVTTQITSDYGFTLLEMPYASIDRVWINNQTQFYMDANKVAVRVNEEKLFVDYYMLTGFYLTTDNARAV